MPMQEWPKTVMMIARAAALALAGYHKILSPMLPRACRFYPSCSVYAAQAMKKYGLVKGSLLGLQRMGRCHPRSGGGYDPVR